MATVKSVAEECNITYRQIDYWLRNGFIPGVSLTGSGIPRSLQGYQVEYIKKLSAYTAAGVKLKKAIEFIESNSFDMPQYIVGKRIANYKVSIVLERI